MGRKNRIVPSTTHRKWINKTETNIDIFVLNRCCCFFFSISNSSSSPELAYKSGEQESGLFIVGLEDKREVDERVDKRGRKGIPSEVSFCLIILHSLLSILLSYGKRILKNNPSCMPADCE